MTLLIAWNSWDYITENMLKGRQIRTTYLILCGFLLALPVWVKQTGGICLIATILFGLGQMYQQKKIALFLL
jgi:hypothetical protein